MQADQITGKAKLRKSFEKSRALNQVFIFTILVVAVFLIPAGIFLAFSGIESETVRTISVVLGGIVGLLGAVELTRFLEERIRKHHIEELRVSEKEFFERVRHDLLLRLTAKVR